MCVFFPLSHFNRLHNCGCYSWCNLCGNWRFFFFSRTRASYFCISYTSSSSMPFVLSREQAKRAVAAFLSIHSLSTCCSIVCHTFVVSTNCDFYVDMCSFTPCQVEKKETKLYGCFSRARFSFLSMHKAKSVST